MSIDVFEDFRFHVAQYLRFIIKRRRVSEAVILKNVRTEFETNKAKFHSRIAIAEQALVLRARELFHTAGDHIEEARQLKMRCMPFMPCEAPFPLNVVRQGCNLTQRNSRARFLDSTWMAGRLLCRRATIHHLDYRLSWTIPFVNSSRSLHPIPNSGTI
jgi:hypothetical protein